MGAALLRWVVLALAALVCGCGGERGERPVAIALDFTPNAVHAGIYEAALGDADTRRGLELRPRAPGASTDSLKLLESGRIDLAILDIHDLGIARERDADIVGVGAIVQRPLAAVIARRRIERPRQLEGRRVGVTGLPSDEAVLRAVVENDGGSFERVRPITIGFSAVSSLVAGKVDAVVTFWNAEGVTLRRRGFPTREFRVDRYGAPRYPELILAAPAQTAATEPQLVDAVLALIGEGTERALRRPGPALDAIAEASGTGPEQVRAQFDALEHAFADVPRLDRNQLEAWSQFDARFGILRRPIDVGAAFPPAR
jgi:NitT/TauT family transport system substrate-binding protein/putative hydroxymethylpyrimidine transport system substrate-binding protein